MTTKESRMEMLIRKAGGAREQAVQINDPWIRKSLEEIARGYEVLAEKEAERQERGKGETSNL